MPFAPNVEGDNAAEWVYSLPVVTKAWTGALILVTCSVNFAIIGVQSVLWDWEFLRKNFEIWRILTPFCFAGKFSFNCLIMMVMVLQFSRAYESAGPYDTGAGSGTADYVFMLMFGIAVILASYPILTPTFQLIPLFTENLVFYVMYVWSTRHPEVQTSIWMFPVKAKHLPFATLVFKILMGSPYEGMVHGISVGHLYYFLVHVVPHVYGKDVLHTPQFLIDIFGIGRYVPEGGGVGGWANETPQNQQQGQQQQGFGRPPPGQQQQQPPRHNWGGSGRALGSS